MPDQPEFIYAETDHAILRGIAVHRPMGQRGYYALLQHKLMAGEVVEDVEVPPTVVRLNGVVRYRIGEGKPLEHKLVIGPAREVLGRTVSVRSLYGLALIGARDGQVVTLTHLDGPTEEVQVEAVLSQPESAAARLRALQQPAEVSG